MVSPSHIMQAWARTFSNSRTFPGQEYRANNDLHAGRDAADRFAVLGGHAFDEVAFESGRSSLRSASRGRLDLDHRQPVEQVFPKLLLLDHLAQVAVGGGHHADIGFPRGRRADALELAGFEHAQQLGLGGQGKVADLVQEDGAAGGVFEQPHLVLGGAGEGALHVAEQLAFKEGFDNGGGVADGEPRGSGGTQPVKRPGHQFFARPGGAGHQARS